MNRERILLVTLWLFSALMARGGEVVHYDVRRYGAVGDTTRLSTAAIQRAIDDCAAHGGGTVWIPAGDYLCTTLHLRDHITLHLDAGATLYASLNPADYAREGHQVGAADTEAAHALVRAKGVKHISLTGSGTLHGRARRMPYRRNPPRVAVPDSVTGREIAGAIKYGADYRSKWKKVPPYTGAVNFTDCSDVTIRDIRVIEANFWSVHLQWCNRVQVNGVYIESNPHNGVNSDGLDIDGCSDVTISNCIINTGDDALCLKTTRLNGESRPCEWITVTGCVLTSSSAALKLGTESHADFRNITVTGCVIKNANRGLNMIIRDGGRVQNVVFSDLVIHTCRKETFWWGNGDPLWFTIQKRKGAASAGFIENVVISNVIAHGQSGVRMEGFSEHIRNIRIDNFQLFMHPEDAVDKRSCHGFHFYGVDGLKIHRCSVVWDKENPEPTWQKAYSFEEVTGLEEMNNEGLTND